VAYKQSYPQYMCVDFFFNQINDLVEFIHYK